VTNDGVDNGRAPRGHRAEADPRMAPLEEAHMPEDTRQLLAELGPRSSMRIFRTLARHPRLLERWFHFGKYIAMESMLPSCDRESVVLRIGWLCASRYELAAHLPIAHAAGLMPESLARIFTDATASGPARDAVLLRAADELCRHADLSDRTWHALLDCFDTRQVLDLIFTVGQYQLVSMLANALRLVPEESPPGLPEALPTAFERRKARAMTAGGDRTREPG
jgi:4-carboxymuconolactone decarboxylase